MRKGTVTPTQICDDNPKTSNSRKPLIAYLHFNVFIYTSAMSQVCVVNLAVGLSSTLDIFSISRSITV